MRQWKRVAYFPVVAIAAVSALSCSGPEKKVVAKVGDRKITVADVVLQYRSMSLNVRPFVETLEGKRNFVNDIINKELLIAEAKRRGVDKSPELERAVRAYEDGVLAEKAYVKNVREKIHVTDETLRALYDRMNEQAQLRVIFEPSEDKAREVERQLKGGADFATVARDQSADIASAQRGGDLGMKPWADYPPEIVTAARPLAVGAVSGVIPAQGGFAIVKLEARQPNPLQDFESEKPNLMERVKAAEENRLAAEWQASMRAAVNAAPDSAGIALVISKMREAQGRRAAAYRGPVMEMTDSERALPILHVGPATWTVRDYLAKLAEIPPERRPALSVNDQQLASFVVDLAVRDRAIEDARKAGLDQDPETRASIERYREMQMVSLLHLNIAEVDSVPADDVNKYYQDHQASLIAPAAARVVPATFPTREAAQTAMRRVRQQTTTLKRLAVEESLEHLTEAQAEEGILVGRTDNPTALEKAVFATDEKRVGGPVKTEKGWTIFRVVQKSGEVPLTLAQATPQIQAKLRDEMAGQQFDEWLASEREKARIKVDEKVLASIDFGSRSRSDSTQMPVTPPEGESAPTPVTAATGGGK